VIKFELVLTFARESQTSLACRFHGGDSRSRQDAILGARCWLRCDVMRMNTRWDHVVRPPNATYIATSVQQKQCAQRTLWVQLITR